jgi:hypothetical protein
VSLNNLQADISGSARKKHKHGTGGVRVSKGQDFWSQAERWFEVGQAKHGERWSSEGWKRYITTYNP